MAFLVLGAVAALVAILFALTGSSAARRILSGMVGMIAVALLVLWLLQNQ
jgi:hypothetical protein